MKWKLALVLMLSFPIPGCVSPRTQRLAIDAAASAAQDAVDRADAAEKGCTCPPNEK